MMWSATSTVRTEMRRRKMFGSAIAPRMLQAMFWTPALPKVGARSSTPPPNLSDGATVVDRPADGKENGRDRSRADRSEPIDIAASDVQAAPTPGGCHGGASCGAPAGSRCKRLSAPRSQLLPSTATASSLPAATTRPARIRPVEFSHRPTREALAHPINVGVHDFHVANLFADGTTLYAERLSLLRSVDHGASWMKSFLPCLSGT